MSFDQRPASLKLGAGPWRDMPAWKADLELMGAELAAVEFDWPNNRDGWSVENIEALGIFKQTADYRTGIFTELAYIPARYLP